MTAAGPNLYRTALDLVAARQQDEYDIFEAVLGELATDFAPVGVLGVLAIANLSVQKTSAVFQRSPGSLLSGLRVEPVPATREVVPDVLTMLYTSTEDVRAASRIARDLGTTEERAQPSMVVLADVSVAMAERLTRFAGLSGPQVVAAWRQYAEIMLADGTWSLPSQ